MSIPFFQGRDLGNPPTRDKPGTCPGSNPTLPGSLDAPGTSLAPPGIMPELARRSKVLAHFLDSLDIGFASSRAQL
jgi:hypothetical protein